METKLFNGKNQPDLICYLLFLTPLVGNLLTPLVSQKHFQLHVESVKRLVKNQLIVLTCREKFLKQTKALTLSFVFINTP
jgi:hypothetical protein